MVNIKNFDYKFYIDYYKDLKKNKVDTFEKAFGHFKNHGIKESRFYSFNDSKIYYTHSWILYKKNNSDLSSILKTEKDAFEHYMSYGKNEDRKLFKLDVPYINKFNWDLFDYKFYIDINSHLNLKSKEEAIKHFKNHGHKINLLYSVQHSNLYFNYDWDRYLSENDDLENFNKKDAFIHYISHGMNEDRKLFKKDDLKSKLTIFNWKFYIQVNNDLILNGICDKKKAIKHFKTSGYKEDRLYSQYHYLLYINYDWSKYSSMYKLNKNNFEAFKYYITNGIRNKHRIFYLISQQNFYTEFFKEINNLQHLKSFSDCKKYYLKLENKIPYSYEHYLIYILFDWKKIYDLNKQYLLTIQITNPNDFYREYINNIEKYKTKLILTDDLDKIYNFEKVDDLFTNTNLINLIINENIIINDHNFILNLLIIQKKLNKILSFNFNFINLPPGYEFSDYKFNNENIRFTFVISSFNNEDNIYNNLLSVIYQNYTNWRIYYTNDASTDNTHEKFNEIVNKYNIKNKVSYCKNENNMRQAYCKARTYKKLKDQDVVVLLDGDDWLARNDALSLLAFEYNNPINNLVIYSGYHVYYNNKIDRTVNGCEYPEDVKISKAYRTHPGWLFTHLKTGYAWLFKKIPEEYFMMDENWLDRCTDLAEMYSVAELAGVNVKHLNKILYVYNKQNSIKYSNSYYNDSTSNDRKKTENHIKLLRPLNIYLPKIYIINLKNRTDLKENIIKQLNILNIKNYEFLHACNGYIDRNIQDKYDEYTIKYDNDKISKTTLGVKKKHINSLGALGIIFSTIKLYKKINENKNLNHVLILEDDVYFHKNFKKYYQLLNKDLYNKDYIFLGYNSTSYSINRKFFNSQELLIPIEKDEELDGGIYGAYSYICSRKYRDYILSLDIDYFINSNVNLDAAINIYLNTKEKYYKENDLNFYIYNTHLFIPEVRKNGINSIRNDNFYKERYLNLENYLI